jgi:hypothetical protein
VERKCGRRKKIKIEGEILSCKRAAEREKRYEEGRQNKLEDAAAVVRDGMANEISEVVQLGKDLNSLGKVYGYVTSSAPDCATLLGPEKAAPSIDFLKNEVLFDCRTPLDCYLFVFYICSGVF